MEENAALAFVNLVLFATPSYSSGDDVQLQFSEKVDESEPEGYIFSPPAFLVA